MNFKTIFKATHGHLLKVKFETPEEPRQKESFTLDCKLFFSGLYQVLIKPGRRAGGQKVIAMQEQSLRMAKTKPKVFFFPRLSLQSKITKELSLHWKAEIFTIRTQVKIFIIHRDI